LQVVVIFVVVVAEFWHVLQGAKGISLDSQLSFNIAVIEDYDAAFARAI